MAYEDPGAVVAGSSVGKGEWANKARNSLVDHEARLLDVESDLGDITSTELRKTVTGIADATATAILTVTVPNASHFAQIEVNILGTLGAGGAIGAGEAGNSSKYLLTVVRTPGLAAVVTLGAQLGAAAANVAGAATVTATLTASAMTGANSATQTFTVKVTITKSGGSSANHVCNVRALLLNGNASGITIA